MVQPNLSRYSGVGSQPATGVKYDMNMNININAELLLAASAQPVGYQHIRT